MLAAVSVGRCSTGGVMGGTAGCTAGLTAGVKVTAVPAWGMAGSLSVGIIG